MNRLQDTLRIFAAWVMMFAMLFPAVVFAQRAPSAKPLTEDQRILHVLNRLGFGARPGDVARVKAMGLSRYIDKQLDPESIDDSVADDGINHGSRAG